MYLKKSLTNLPSFAKQFSKNTYVELMQDAPSFTFHFIKNDVDEM